MPVSPVTYPVMETFSTLQGEGAHTGLPSYFLRLAGCDVACAWCDVKESWNVDGFPRQTVAEIVTDALASNLSTVVLTGGEPCMYDLQPLTDGLHAAGLVVHIETSGSSPITGDYEWVTLSPKKFKSCLDSSFPLADELKVVVLNKHDLEWAQEQASKVKASCELYLQPEWSKKERVQEMMMDFFQSNSGRRWKMSIQTHKYLGIR